MACLGDEDPFFLSLVADAEAEAVADHSAIRSSGKRAHPSSNPSSQPAPPSKLPRPQSGEPRPVEGSYLAALRGTHSPLWRDLHRPNPEPNLKPPNTPAGSCFRCGAQGHWAKDCPVAGAPPPDDPSGHVADKECPCGAGTCLVLTSNTAKNPGRRFYRCPVKQENGGCNFFEWCDTQPSLAGVGGGGSARGEVKCPCGAGWCLVLTVKSGRNVGRIYFKCPAEGERSCGYFKWCDQENIMGTYDNTPSNANVHASVGKSGSCFKCGREGHWSRECPMLQSNTSVGVGVTPTDSSTACFKCGKVGHWARDCSLQVPKAPFSR